MKFTNKLNLPQYLVDWLTNDDYDYATTPNTISATGLLKPVRAQILSSRHSNELEMDVSEKIASKYGNAIHDSIERIKTEGVSKEKRVMKVLNIDGTDYTITGKYDLLVEESPGKFRIRDIKTTSVWTFIYGGKDEDYRSQLSIYYWLLSDTHHIEPEAYIDFFFTDWQGSKAKSEKGYPQQRIHPGYKIKLMPLEETEKFIKEKVSQYIKYKDTVDDLLPECTREELWAEPDTYAVYKIGGKRAKRVTDSKDSAEAYQKANKIDGYIQRRPGKIKRCKYCSAAPFCNQYQELAIAGMIDL